jgi:tetratricopeptide (TPR) repeat protein/transcriptional regulator with XRE-family HTH domain
VPDETAPEFGGLLRQLRIEAGLTQEELAARASVSCRSVSDLERGINRTARKMTSQLLSDALGLEGERRARFVAVSAGRVPPAEPLLAGDRWAAGTAAAVRSLPRDITTFTGRVAELERLTGLAAGAGPGAVVVICAIGGMAGIGKTALSVHAASRLAQQFPDGQFFVALHGHTPGQQRVDPAAALSDLLLAAGVPAAQIPAGVDARAARWRDYLAGRRILLVLDDAASHVQVTPLLPGASAGSLVLITSRHRLSALEDAQTIDLDALPPADAATLFTRLARRPGLESGDPAVAEMTRLCGYLPLAIGMLAGQLRHHPSWTAASLAADAAKATSRLDLMHSEDLSVAAAFDVSYRSLTMQQRRLFRRLGLLSGPDVDAYAAAALDGTSLAAARRGLEALYDRHLITEPRPGRYRLHDLVRAHAQALAARDDPAACEAATAGLLDYYVHTVLAAARLLYPGGAGDDAAIPGRPPRHAPAFSTQAEAASWVAAERANLYAVAEEAVLSGRRVAAYLIPAALAGSQDAWGEHWDQALVDYQSALDYAIRDGDLPGQARSLTLVGYAHYLHKNLAGTIASADQAEILYQNLGDRVGQAGAAGMSGNARAVSGDFAAGAECLTRAITLFSGLGYHKGHAGALVNLAAVQIMTGDRTAGEASARQAFEISRRAGDRSGQRDALAYVAWAEREGGEYLTAVATLKQALDLNRDTGDRYMQAYIIFSTAEVLRMAGDYPAALGCVSQAREQFLSVGREDCESIVLNEIGLIKQHMGDYQAARDCYQQALSQYEAYKDPLGATDPLINLGNVESHEGSTARARDYYRQALDVLRKHNLPGEEARALEGIGLSHLKDGDHDDGIASLQEALAIYQRIDSPFTARVRQVLRDQEASAHTGE